MLRKLLILAAVVVVSSTVTAGSVWAADLLVTQPTQVTTNAYYERGNSVLKDGSGNYWLFYGRSYDFTGNYGTGNPDNSHYEIYYNKASTVAGLATATPQVVGSMPVTADRIYQGQTSCIEYGGAIWVFAVDSGDGAQVKAWTTTDGGTSWSVADVLPGAATSFAGSHLWATVYGGEIWLVVNTGGALDVTTYNGSTWSASYTVVAHEGMPRFFVDGGGIYLYYTSWGLPAYYVYEYSTGPTWTLKATITGTLDLDCDPMLTKIGSDYVFFFAPWDGTKQFLKYWTASSITGFDGLDQTTAKIATGGGYGGTSWVDMWPATLEDGGDVYMFYGSEASGTSSGTGNVYLLPVDWDLTLDHYCYIQNAIDAASAADVIEVGAGNYAERLTINPSVDLRGAQYGVDPTGVGARTTPADESIVDITGIGVTNPNVAVEIPGGVTGASFAGFTVIGSPTFNYSDESVIRCWDDNLTIEDNILDGYIGVLYKGNDFTTVNRNRMVVNKTGVIVQPNVTTNITISNNTITPGGGPAGDAAGIYMTGVTTASVTGNVVTGFTGSRGCGGSNVTDITISGNDLSGNKDGVSFWGTTTFVTIEDNDLDGQVRFGINIKGQDIVIEGNDLSGCGDSGVNVDKHVIDTERVTITDNDLSGNTSFGVKVGGAVVETVDASANYWGSTDAATVQAEANAGVGADYTPWLGGGTAQNPGYAGDFSTLYVDDDSPQTGTDGPVEEGIKLVSGSTVNVLPGTYTEAGQIVVDKDVAVVGDSSSKPVIMTDSDTGTAGDTRGWWLVEAGYSLSLEDLVLDGTGHLIYQGIRAHGGGAMNDCDMRNILYNESGPHYSGVALVFFGSQNWTVTSNTFENIGRIGIFGFGTGITGSTISGNTYTGKGVGDWLDYGIELGGGAVATITGNIVTECRGVASSDGSTSAGVLIDTYYGPGTAGTLTSNAFTANTVGIHVGYDGSDTAVVTANFNDLSGNDSHGMLTTSTTVVANGLSNWWGDATGPFHATLNPGGVGVPVSDNVLFDPWVGKAGTGNIVCVPDPEYLTVASPAKTIDVDYLGGGGGLMYGYSVKFTWDGAIASSAAVKVTQGSLLSDEGTTFFMAGNSGANEVTVDCALLGDEAGVTGPGTMFSVEFTGLSQGTSDVDITVLNVRDNNNQPLSGFYEDDGLLIVDVQAPVVTTTLIENLTLAHTDDYIKDTDTARVTATVTDDDPTFGIPNIVADLSGLGGGAAVNPDTYVGNVATWTTTIASVACTPADGTVTVTVDATDPIGNPAAQDSDTIIADNTPPTAVTAFDAAVGHKKCDLTWTMGTDLYLAGVTVRRSDNAGEYPTYPLFVAGWPAGLGGYYPADETQGFEAYNGPLANATDAVVPRNIYYYQAFCYDIARNYGPAATTASDLSNNYWLGDVATTLGVWGFNGLVNDADIDKLGGTYFATNPVGNNAECDVGPTVHPNGHRLGLPLPDAAVQFEDLMIFAMNYGRVSPRIVPFLPDEAVKALSLELAEVGVTDDGEIEVAMSLRGNAGEVKGISTIVAFDSSELEFVSARLSDDMYSPLAPVFFWHAANGNSVQVDMAVLGTDVTVGGSGDIAVLTFRALADEYALEFEAADLRGAGNEDLFAELEGCESRPEVPATFRLVGNSPNPFNPVTKIAFNVPYESRVTVTIYDVTGREVRTLVNGTVEPGQHEIVWDGRNDRGDSVGSGVYFCTMQAADFHDSHKMMLLK
jgi:nitrous oxidase accessory protein NosD